MVAPTERRARSAIASLQGKPISRIACGLIEPSLMALMYAGLWASASSPSLAASACRSRISVRSAASRSRSSWYFAIGNRCPGGSGSTNWVA